jgi:hypothetical protein
MSTAFEALRHAAETGGGPSGFGWASFVTFAVGTGVVLYSAGQLLKVVHSRRNRNSRAATSPDRTSDSTHSTTP